MGSAEQWIAWLRKHKHSIEKSFLCYSELPQQKIYELTAAHIVEHNKPPYPKEIDENAEIIDMPAFLFYDLDELPENFVFFFNDKIIPKQKSCALICDNKYYDLPVHICGKKLKKKLTDDFITKQHQQ